MRGQLGLSHFQSGESIFLEIDFNFTNFTFDYLTETEIISSTENSEIDAESYTTIIPCLALTSQSISNVWSAVPSTTLLTGLPVNKSQHS